MNRERALKVLLVLVGLLFVAAIYPMAMSLWHPSPSDDTGDTMMMSLYFTLGVFLLVTTRKPSAHRSLIAFTAWSSFAHAVVMTILGFHMPSERVGFWIGSRWLRRSSQESWHPHLARRPIANASGYGSSKFLLGSSARSPSGPTGATTGAFSFTSPGLQFQQLRVSRVDKSDFCVRRLSGRPWFGVRSTMHSGRIVLFSTRLDV